ncbi:hypothetical protein C8Q79DRAFT_350529 [Trametes meyenii]|nr:hypothetical protein C8Q79DRAFT_350529 [Trametes meyenii]
MGCEWLETPDERRQRSYAAARAGAFRGAGLAAGALHHPLERASVGRLIVRGRIPMPRPSQARPEPQKSRATLHVWPPRTCKAVRSPGAGQKHYDLWVAERSTISQPAASADLAPQQRHGQVQDRRAGVEEASINHTLENASANSLGGNALHLHQGLQMLGRAAQERRRTADYHEAINAGRTGGRRSPFRGSGVRQKR